MQYKNMFPAGDTVNAMEDDNETEVFNIPGNDKFMNLLDKLINLFV